MLTSTLWLSLEEGKIGSKINCFYSNRNAQFKEHSVLLKSIYKECVGDSIKETNSRSTQALA